MEQDSLWHYVIASKYGMHHNGWDANVNFNASLRFPWKSISKGWDSFVVNTKWVVGKSDKIQFWEDSWVARCPLKESFPRLYRISSNCNMCIQLVIFWVSHSSHSWGLANLRNFNHRECDEFISLLNSIDTICSNRDVSDKRNWVGHSSGEFSCNSFFEILSCPSSNSFFPQFIIIWKGDIPTKIKVFAWLAFLGKERMYVIKPTRTTIHTYCMTTYAFFIFWAFFLCICLYRIFF